jgi:hypothetical protein
MWRWRSSSQFVLFLQDFLSSLVLRVRSYCIYIFLVALIEVLEVSRPPMLLWVTEILHRNWPPLGTTCRHPRRLVWLHQKQSGSFILRSSPVEATLFSHFLRALERQNQVQLESASTAMAPISFRFGRPKVKVGELYCRTKPQLLVLAR